MAKDERRGLPRVDHVVGHPSVDDARKRLGFGIVTRLARAEIAQARESVRRGAAVPSVVDIAGRVAASASRMLESRARRVINATGVVLHTNLGRAPLGQRAVDALAKSAIGYTSIEIDLVSGKRGRRGAFAEDALRELTNAEAALIVNNNAAAVLLMLGTLAAGRAVVVSRGELVEIGGGFRVPDVMARSGARLIEVGTTNKTRISDYARALDEVPDVAAILRVHQGNFRQVGFVERPEHAALARLARDKHVLLLEDLGGGALVDLAPLGMSSEPTVMDSVALGSDIVCFSTDKVLGGPQGGALVGRLELVERCRRDPLARALRLGRLPLVALEATLACYLEGDMDGIPALTAMRMPTSAVRERAERIHRALEQRGIVTTVVELRSAVGGGACAEEPLASWGVAMEANGAIATSIAARLRTGEPAVLPRVQDERILFDVRTLLADEDEALVMAIERAISKDKPS